MKIVFALTLLTHSLLAIDWIHFFGKEPSFLVKGSKTITNGNTPTVLAFLQPQYTKNSSNIFVNGAGQNTTPFAYTSPTLEKQDYTSVFRAKLGLRGKWDDKFSYFILTEFGDNGVTKPLGVQQEKISLTDISATYHVNPLVNIRAGRFYMSGAEESLNIITSPFIHFTFMTENLLLDRYASSHNTATIGDTEFHLGKIDDSVGAFHDTALQLFGKSKLQTDSQLSYAFTLGKGAGLSSISNRKNEYYAYLAYENFFEKSTIADTQSLKAFLWYQKGQRNFATSTNNDNWHDRLRYGAGLTYDRSAIHGGLELLKAKGSILHGLADTNTQASLNDWYLQFAVGNENEANGGAAHIGYDVLPKLRLLYRYDYLNMLPNSTTFKKRFTSSTFGASYKFKGVNRLDINYVKRDAKTDNTQFQPILENMGDIFSVRLTILFNSKML